MRRKGFVLVAMAAVTAGVLAVAGLAVDTGRMMIAKNELQVYCDSAAMAAAGKLDGTAGGIGAAQNAVTSSPNRWDFGTETVAAPVVTFATSAAGPWVSSPNPASGYAYAQVAASVPVRVYFLALATGLSVSNVTASAKAGQIPLTAMPRGLAPYTSVSVNTTGPDFGLVYGAAYSIQWPTYNDTRAGCSANTPGKCFVANPCAGDPDSSLRAVVANWGASYDGYWGSNSNSAIASAVLSGVQIAPLNIGDNIDGLLSTGNKQSEASYLDQRASQDTDSTDNKPSTYVASSAHNGRRLLPVAIVHPVDPSHTTVIGYGQFLLYSNGSPSNYYQKTGNGNSPYCALYAGPYNIGSIGPGVGGTTGASSVRLIE